MEAKLDPTFSPGFPYMLFELLNVVEEGRAKAK